MSDCTRARGRAASLPILLAAALAASGPAGAATHDVIIDGSFADWASVPVTYTDPTGDALGGAVDFGVLKVASDRERAYLYFEIGAEMNLQNDNGIVLYADVDNDPATGHAVGGIGAEVEWRFGERTGVVRHAEPGLIVRQADVGLRQGPTVTSTVFEVSFDRRAATSGELLMEDRNVAILLQNESGGTRDTLPDRGETLVVELSGAAPVEPCPTFMKRRDAGDIRVVTYNVLFDGIFKRHSAFRRILRAIDPDIICFQEIYEHSEKQIADRLSTMFSGTTWYVTSNGDCAIASRFPVQNRGEGKVARAVWGWVDLPDDRFDRDLSLVCAHLPCCGDNEGRQDQLNAIVRWHRMMRETGLITPRWGMPFMIAGDMNLVGYSEQLDSLLNGWISDEQKYGVSRAADWDDTGFADAMPYHTTCREAYTWRDDAETYAPGRLDYIVYTDSVLEIRNHFVLWTPDLTDAELRSLERKTP
jgi:exonuclease III